MLSNSLNINELSGKIEKLSLSFKSNQVDYKDLFYDHLTSMMKYLLLNPTIEHEKIKFNERNYKAIGQYIFENSTVVETESGNAINWDLVDEGKDILRTKIKKMLRTEGYSEHLKPIIEFTVDSYENSLIYNQLHPSSSFNPWIPTNHILENGYLFVASDDRNLIEHYQKDIYLKADSDSQNNIGIITKSNKASKDLSGFIVDNRHNIQTIVFDYLKTEAKGIGKAISIKRISEYLSLKNFKFSDQYIKDRVLLPLKRAGLIGSYTKGFFCIDSVEDLIYTYKSHLDKQEAIERTLRLYEEKGKKMNIDLTEFRKNINDISFD